MVSWYGAHLQARIALRNLEERILNFEPVVSRFKENAAEIAAAANERAKLIDAHFDMLRTQLNEHHDRALQLLRNVESDAQVSLQCSFAGVEEQLAAMKEAHSSLAANLDGQSSKPRFIQNFRKLMSAAEPLLALPSNPPCAGDLILDLRVLPPVDAVGIVYGGSDKAGRSRPSELCSSSAIAAMPSAVSPVHGVAQTETVPDHGLAECEPCRVTPMQPLIGAALDLGACDGGRRARREDTRSCRPVGVTELIARGYSPRNMREYFEPSERQGHRVLHASRASPHESKAVFVAPSMRPPELVSEHTAGGVKFARTPAKVVYDDRDQIIHELTRSYQARVPYPPVAQGYR
jgi:hypothetical protein